MRYTEQHKAETKARILEAVAGAIRKEGLDGLAIPELMKRAGLTHGGFYNHFASRDDLVAQAIAVAASGGAFADEARSFADAVAAYLSMGHVEHPELGCVVAGIGADGARATGPVRRAFAEAARGLLRRVHRKVAPGSRRPEALSDESLVAASQLVGAVLLARAVDDPKLARRILSASERALERR